jgi:hypothetical protein
MKSVISAFLSAAVLSSAAATGAFGQTNDTGRALVASNVLKLSADTERSGTFSTTVKEFIVPYAGVVRVRWQLKSDGTGIATATVLGTIDTCSSTNGTTAYQLGICDLRVVAGDRVLVSARGTMDPFTFVTSTAFIRRVRITFNVVDATGVGATLVD